MEMWAVGRYGRLYVGSLEEQIGGKTALIPDGSEGNVAGNELLFRPAGREVAGQPFMFRHKCRRVLGMGDKESSSTCRMHFAVENLSGDDAHRATQVQFDTGMEAGRPFTVSVYHHVDTDVAQMVRPVEETGKEGR